MSAKTKVPTVKLNDGNACPVIGFGIGTAHFGREASEHVVSALNTGYTYIDGAQLYGNSKSIGEALKQWGGKREDVFILTKCGTEGGGEANNPRTVLEGLLKEMGVSYVELYLVHSPLFAAPLSLSESWKIMEQIKKDGLAKSIGVSNYRAEDVEEIAKTWEIPPSVNQIEYHPYIYHAPNVLRLKEVLDKYNVKIQAYGPLTPIFRSKGGPIDGVVDAIAKEKGASDVQILLAWAAQQTGGIAVTTSSKPDRQREQLETFTKMAPLTIQQVEAISEAGKKRTFRHFQHGVWDAAKP